MLTVLVTGSMGVGKTCVLSLLETESQSVFIADEQAKELLKSSSPCYKSLKRIFDKQDLCDAQGEFDTTKLADEIFTYPDKRKAMEAIIHPLVHQFFQTFVQQQRKKGKNKVFFEVPLISKEIFCLCDQSILLLCPEKIRTQRLIRAGWAKQDIEKRYLAQIPESEIQSHADFVIDNSGDLKNLNHQIKQILSRLDLKNNTNT